MKRQNKFLKNFKLFDNRQVVIYGLRKLGAKTYFYVGSTNEHPETRALRHIRAAKKGTHENKKLAAVILTSHFVVDILEIVNERNRLYREYDWIISLKKNRHKLLNSRNPLKPRQPIEQSEKDKQRVKSRRNKTNIEAVRSPGRNR